MTDEPIRPVVDIAESSPAEEEAFDLLKERLEKPPFRESDQYVPNYSTSAHQDLTDRVLAGGNDAGPRVTPYNPLESGKKKSRTVKG